jgi:hypothetical protein
VLALPAYRAGQHAAFGNISALQRVSKQEADMLIARRVQDSSLTHVLSDDFDVCSLGSFVT